MRFKLLLFNLSFFLFLNSFGKDLHFFLIKDNICESLNSLALDRLKKLFKVDTFVETGTLRGGSTIRVAAVFDSVHTIELRESYYQFAKNKLEGFHNVSCHLGDSSVVLKSILDTVSAHTIMFWLDGHDDAYTPIMQEIEAIKASRYKNSVILIDDLQSFNSLDYPSLQLLIEHIHSINQEYKIVVIGDVLLAYPKDLYPGITISPILDACTTSRLFDAGIQTVSVQELIEKELSIGSALGEEKKNIESLASIIQHDSHYRLWLAMIKFSEGRYQDVINELNIIIGGKKLFYHDQRTIKHWRLYLYKALAARKMGDGEQVDKMLKKIRRQVSSFSLEDYTALGS